MNLSFYKHLLLFIAASWVLNMNAQEFQRVKQWAGLSEEEARAIVLDADGNQYIAGFFGNTLVSDSSSLTGVRFRDGLLGKYNAAGEEQFLLQLASSFGDEIATGIGIDTAGFVYLLLEHRDTVRLQNQAIGTSSGWSVVKFDTDGNLISSFDPIVKAPDIFELADMDVNPQGTIVLTGSFGRRSSQPSELEIGTDTLVTSQEPGGQYVEQMWVAAYDSDGQNLWAKATRAMGREGAQGTKITFAENDDIFVGGQFSDTLDFGVGTTKLSTTSESNIFIARYDITGAFVWADGITATDTTPGAEPTSVVTALHWGADQALYVGGSFIGEMAFGEDTIATAPKAPGPFFTPIWSYLARYKQDQPSWMKLFAGGKGFGANNLTTITTNLQGRVYAGGSLTDTMIIDTLKVTGTDDLYFAELNTSGQTVALYSMAASSALGLTSTLDGMTTTPAGELYMCGRVDAPAMFGNIQVTESIPSCCSNAFIALFADSTLPPTSNEPLLVEQARYRVYPNPTADHWTLESMVMTGAEVNVALMDIYGRIVYQRTASMSLGEKLLVPAENLASGYYWLKIQEGEKIKAIKLNKQ